jgi:histone deacetylase HOS3
LLFTAHGQDGNYDLVAAASLSIHGSHGQHIENVHLQPYSSEEQFWEVLYKTKYNTLLSKAEAFVQSTGSRQDDVMVFIRSVCSFKFPSYPISFCHASCGFDACEHEHASMSRHNRKVPSSFYYRFAKDAVAFADRHAQGRLVSVLEGGYSDRALISGSMAHLSGLVDTSGLDAGVDEEWWSVENLAKVGRDAYS